MPIAILGWGSLVWRPEGLPILGEWLVDGPILPIEFSRQSSDGRLTLVIDPEHGAPVTTLYAQSSRTNLNQALADLRKRERTNLNNIGYVDIQTGQNRCRVPELLNGLREWTTAQGLNAVIWTDLEPNLPSFSVQTAEAYLRGLTGEAASAAREYIARAPAQTDTPLRRRLSQSRWLNAS